MQTNTAKERLAKELNENKILIFQYILYLNQNRFLWLKPQVFIENIIKCTFGLKLIFFQLNHLLM